MVDRRLLKKYKVGVYDYEGKRHIVFLNDYIFNRISNENSLINWHVLNGDELWARLREVVMMSHVYTRAEMEQMWT